MQFVHTMAKRPRDSAKENVGFQDGGFLGESIECSICTGRMLEHIFACREGHCVCQHCYGKLSAPTKCPQCRIFFPPSRNRGLECVVEKCTFKCDHGCGFAAKPEHILKHQRECDRAPVLCPWPDCEEKLSAADLKQHIQDLHSQAVEPGNVYVEEAIHAGKCSVDVLIPIDSDVFNICLLCDGRVNDGLWFRGMKSAETWHIRTFHFLKPRKVRLKLGPEQCSHEIADRTESIRCLADWNPDQAGKEGRAGGFLVAEEKMKMLKDPDEEEDLWVKLCACVG